MRQNAKPRRGRASLPFVLVNMAMTADGKITTANRAVASFGSRHDQAHLFQLRATADAVMAGARTVDLNPVSLGPGPAKYRRLRTRRGLAECNLRIIVSGHGSVNPGARVFGRRFSPIVVLTTAQAPANKIKRLRSVATAVRVCGADEVNLRSALRWLRRRWGVKRLICEGGGALNNALFRAGLVNELHLTVCPRVLGGQAAPTIADGLGTQSLSQGVRLEIRSARRQGGELFLVYRVHRRGSQTGNEHAVKEGG